MCQNNNSDKLIIKKIARKWSSKNSIWNNAMCCLLSSTLGGTGDVSIFEELKKSTEGVSYWSKYTFAASLGLLFPTKQSFGSEVSSIGLKDDGYAQGGALMASGLANFGAKLAEQDFEPNVQRIIDFNINANQSHDNTSSQHHMEEAVLHGQLFNMGFRYAFSRNQVLTEAIKGKIYQERAVQGEAAGYALGLVQAANLDLDLAEELINGATNNPHERIARASMFALALMGLQHESKVNGVYQRLIGERDAIIRFGAVGLLGMGYAGTSENSAISKLLKVAGTDLSNDVRRLAVICLALVLVKKPRSALKLFEMLSTSYNHSVRHAVGLAAGIVGAASHDISFIKLLETLLEDKTDYVRQAAAIGLGLVCQQATPALLKNVEKIRENLMTKIYKKHESSIAKMGYIFGLGLMGAGGGNWSLQMLTENGDLRLRAVVGVFLFAQYWYWFPTILGLGLALRPTYLIGATANLKVPKGFSFQLKAPKSHFEYYKTKAEEKSKKKNIGPVVLSMTKRAKARVNRKKIQEEGEASVIQEESNDEKNNQNEKETENKKEEEKTHQCINPCRVLPRQERFIQYLQSNRYEVVNPKRKSGIVFIKDKTPGEQEQYAGDQPKEPWLIPPPDFVFTD